MEDFFKNAKLTDIECTQENLLDYNWLFNNIPWINFDNERVKACFDEPIEIFYINNHGYISNTSEIVSQKFNNVIISAVHATINHFTFNFKLDDEKVCSCEFNDFAYSKEALKETLKLVHEGKIASLGKQISNTKEKLEIIKTL